VGLVVSSPVAGGQGVGEGAGWVEHYRQETADVSDCDRAQPAWAFGSVAAVTARKAWASIARVMWRYQPATTARARSHGVQSAGDHRFGQPWFRDNCQSPRSVEAPLCGLVS
jgi:hypothetical protein